MARYHIETYGCTANRGESREIERALRDGGHHPADGPGEADDGEDGDDERDVERMLGELDAEREE